MINRFFRRMKRESNYFLDKNGSTAARKSMVFSKYFLSWVKNYINNLCKFHNIESPNEREYLFFYHIVLSYPKEKVLAVLEFFFGDQPEKLDKYQDLVEKTSIASKQSIRQYYIDNPYFKRVLDALAANLAQNGEELVSNSDIRKAIDGTYSKISKGNL